MLYVTRKTGFGSVPMIPNKGFFDPRGGHLAGKISQFVSIRDSLTDLLLPPPDSSALRLLGMTIPPAVEGVTGVALHWLGHNEDPELVIFVATQDWGLDAFLNPLRVQGLKINVTAGVTFDTAARPIQGGGSLSRGAPGGPEGTMGCVVRSRITGAEFALSCNHVIADLNTAIRGVTEVWEPASGRAGSRRLGVVNDFADIDFTPGAYNVIDAAIAKPDSPMDVGAGVAGIGALAGINASPSFGDPMKKQGVATRRTDGTYLYDINASITFSNGSVALFRDMMGIVGSPANFAAGGDSGAIVVDRGNAAVGMVISVASGINLTLATRITAVLDHFHVDIV